MIFFEEIVYSRPMSAEMSWFYAKAGSSTKEGPVTLGQMQDLVTSRQLSPNDLVWREGWAHWIHVAEAAELSPSAPAAPHPADPLLRGVTRWAQITGLLHILSGLLVCMTCVGLPVGLLWLAAGITLLGMSGRSAFMKLEDHFSRSVLASIKRYLQLAAWAAVLFWLGFTVFIFFHAGLVLGLLRGHTGS